MPRKNSRKTLLENGYYHIYNRGVAKQKIFLDEQDHQVFLRFLKEYLLPTDHQDIVQLREINPRRHPINCSAEVKLLAYCLMPNHFHLLIKNITEKGITRFMKALGANYSMYFNQKYKRVGPLYQGVYKAVLVETDEQLIYLSKYIHRNPNQIMLARVRPLHEYSYSSYPNYLEKRHQDWVNHKEILTFFSKTIPVLTYQSFIEETETPRLLNFSSLFLEKTDE